MHEGEQGYDSGGKVVRPRKNQTEQKHMEKKINGLINIVDFFNLIRLLNYEIGNNYIFE